MDTNKSNALPKAYPITETQLHELLTGDLLTIGGICDHFDGRWWVEDCDFTGNDFCEGFFNQGLPHVRVEVAGIECPLIRPDDFNAFMTSICATEDDDGTCDRFWDEVSTRCRGSALSPEERAVSRLLSERAMSLLLEAKGDATPTTEQFIEALERASKAMVSDGATDGDVEPSLVAAGVC